MQSIDEVHIAPLGYEYDRIVGPVHEHGIDVLYLLEHDGPASERPDYHDDLKSVLRDDGIDVRSKAVDLLDIYDVLGVVTTLVSNHEDDIVRVNVSSGSKLSAVGAAIACMATSATAYYVQPEGYAHQDRNERQSYGYVGEEVLPTYPIESPTRDQVAVMNYLDEADTEVYTPKKKDIIDYAETANLSFISDSNPANDKAKFALLNANIVDPLAGDGYVDVAKVGRQKQVTLTETGRDVLRAFRHKL
ncbi:HFX_2341 family transcriptional regulator domain-containing protein [Haladaptatus sp. DFWS20]|uniref:HFX_2341 family transcriptional regulator domain-containing protein n=1 Tax=Haladaptatus sp. DFWS20 TaxID=3403467 RepID=UPI003EBDB9D9